MDADPLIMVLTVTSVAFISSILTALVGAGGGTGLLLVMLWFVPAAGVVSVHGCIQLVSNTARVVLFRRHMHWPVIIRFVIPMSAGVYVGLQLHGMMSKAALQLVIAGFVLLSLLVRVPNAAAGREFPSWAYVPVVILIAARTFLSACSRRSSAPSFASNGSTRNGWSARSVSSVLPAMSSRSRASRSSAFPSQTTCR